MNKDEQVIEITFFVIKGQVDQLEERAKEADMTTAELLRRAVSIVLKMAKVEA